MSTTHEDRVASNGRLIVAHSPCGNLEFYMFKPMQAAFSRTQPGGVAPPKA